MESSLEQLEDLNFLKNLIGKSVRIGTVDKEVHQDTNISVITFHSVKSFEVTSEDVTQHADPILAGSDIEYRKLKLKNWLKQNRIKVTEVGSTLKIQDEVEIGPPYMVDQCRCSNKIILERILTIIERMPENNELPS